ncbi:MAG: hypothetical protein DMF69_17350 [Acidobacteria bacterium]|nr:MAG: hypothetical protein DMF69_17350 [Acidobacteriota bacterium]
MLQVCFKTTKGSLSHRKGDASFGMKVKVGYRHSEEGRYRRSFLRSRNLRLSMATTTINQQDLFGLFELDEDGVVLYSRMEEQGAKTTTQTKWIGTNFFEVVGAFDTKDQIRAQITSFARSSTAAASFQASFKGESEYFPVKILLARIRDRISIERTKSVLVHIKKIGK